MKHLLSALLLTAAAVFAVSNTSLAQQIDLTAAQRKAIGIETATAISADLQPSSLILTGNVILPPDASAPISSPFDAIVQRPLSLPGERVDAGTPIVRLYSEDYLSMRADLEQKRLERAHLQEVSEREEELAKLGLRSQQEVDTAKYKVAAAQIKIEVAQGQLSRVQQGPQAGEFELTAPIDGYVGRTLVASGQSISKSQPLLLLNSEDRLWLELAVPEGVGTALRVGATIELPAWNELGQIIAIEPEIDLTTRSTKIYASLPSNIDWRVGQLVDAGIAFGSSGSAISVPSRAIVRMGSSSVVFVDRGQSIDPVSVELITQTRTSSIVEGDLKPGDRIVVAGLAALKNTLETG